MSKTDKNSGKTVSAEKTAGANTHAAASGTVTPNWSKSHRAQKSLLHPLHPTSQK